MTHDRHNRQSLMPRRVTRGYPPVSGQRQPSDNEPAQPDRFAPMRFRLRTLLILLAVGPIVIAGAWWYVLSTPVGYVRLKLRERQQLIDKWDAERPGWRNDPSPRPPWEPAPCSVSRSATCCG